VIEKLKVRSAVENSHLHRSNVTTGWVRVHMVLPSWFTGMPNKNDPMRRGDRYSVLSMEKDGEETVYYGFWFE